MKKIAVITGGASGIGAACCREFADDLLDGGTDFDSEQSKADRSGARYGHCQGHAGT